MSILLPDATKAFIASSSVNPPHGLLLSGPVGSGNHTLAQLIASEWGTILDIIQPIAKTTGGVPGISVETVRALYDRTRSKIATAHTVIIDDADAMNPSAQNALLKLLEEPVENVHFILTSHHPDKLLPTVRSRLQTYAIPALDDAASIRLSRQNGVMDETKQRQILFAANGLPAEISRLTTDEKYFASLVERMGMARQFIQGDRYEKIKLIAGFKDDRAAALVFIDTITAILKQSLQRQADVDTMRLIDSLIDASEAIAANGNIRLQLTRAVI